MQKRNTWIFLGLIIGLTIVLVSFLSQPHTPKDFSISIFSIVEIEPIAQLRKGFREEFESSQFAKEHKVHITEENSQGDSGLINQIADKIVTSRPNLVYVLGTPAAQAIQKRAPDILIVQGAVTDPVAAGLAQSWQGSGRKYIATSDLPPIDKQVALIRDLTPKASRIGIIYNTGEANSVAVVSRLRKYIAQAKLNWSVVERSVGNSSDVARAVETLAGKVDVIYLPPDNTVHSAMAVVGKITRENKIPFYATVIDALSQGAISTLSLDFYKLGKESARLALSVLEGQDPATLPIKTNENPTITINAEVAKSYSIDISGFRNRKNVKFVDEK